MNIIPSGNNKTCNGTEGNMGVTVTFLGEESCYNSLRIQDATRVCLERAKNQPDPLTGQRTWKSDCGNYSAVILYDLQ